MKSFKLTLGNKSKPAPQTAALRQIFNQPEEENKHVPSFLPTSSFSWAPPVTADELRAAGLDLEDELYEKKKVYSKPKMLGYCASEPASGGGSETASNIPRKSRYIEKVKYAAEMRAVESELIAERKAHRELELSGKMGAPAFLTSSYQKKLLERRDIVKKIASVESNKNNAGMINFYGHLMSSGHASRSNTIAADTEAEAVDKLKLNADSESDGEGRLGAGVIEVSTDNEAPKGSENDTFEDVDGGDSRNRRIRESEVVLAAVEGGGRVAGRGVKKYREKHDDEAGGELEVKLKRLKEVERDFERSREMMIKRAQEEYLERKKKS